MTDKRTGNRTETHACDLISRQWLMECVNEGWIKFDTEKDENRFIHLVRDIAPSVQPRKGKWIYGEHDVAMCDGYRCDKCGFFVPWDYQHKFIDFIKDYNYCPNCGADMRGEQDDNRRL